MYIYYIYKNDLDINNCIPSDGIKYIYILSNAFAQFRNKDMNK